MVPIGRPSIHHRGFGDGAGHGPGTWISLFRPRPTKVCLVDDVGMYGSWICCYIPVVLLGILIGFLTDWTKWIYRGSQALWFNEYTGKP
jgi:hypothetical protein